MGEGRDAFWKISTNCWNWYGNVSIACNQKIKEWIETLKCTSIRDIFLVKCLLLRFFCKFAVG